MIRQIVQFFLLLLSFYAGAQTCKTEAVTTTTKAALLESIKNDPVKRLVALQKYIPNLAIDLRYATANNFTKTVLYIHPIACMRQAPAAALRDVQQELSRKGLGLKIYDAFRPFSVTCRIWALVPDRRYAANPRKGSHHNRGVAVDITLIDLKTGKDLDMAHRSTILPIPPTTTLPHCRLK